MAKKKAARPKATPKPKLYVIRERIDGEQEEPLFGEGRMVGVYLDRAKAECALRDRDAAKREEGDLSPLAGLWEPKQVFELSDFEPPVFQDWLTDGDIPPLPKKFWDKGRSQWEVWLRKLTKRQAVHLLRGLHKLEFFELVEVDLIEGKYPEGEKDDFERGW